ncbi:GATA transcription factor 4 [Dendrobium catenatum]|uniref:GATA transcription factor 4 n=1 Tax=Dendrobium catenatum TaxID=906689 RepID=A0A2I0VN21_9ASPA|nr:GATA transcription factor 4 [Dendrobium catenatum]
MEKLDKLQEHAEKGIGNGRELQQLQPRRCSHCLSHRTPQWRAGPLGPKTLCNACGVRFKSGRLHPEYRPAKSPTFVSYMHSNSHKKVMEMRMPFRQVEVDELAKEPKKSFQHTPPLPNPPIEVEGMKCSLGHHQTSVLAFENSNPIIA